MQFLFLFFLCLSSIKSLWAIGASQSALPAAVLDHLPAVHICFIHYVYTRLLKKKSGEGTNKKLIHCNSLVATGLQLACSL